MLLFLIYVYSSFIQSSNYDRLKFSYKLRSFFSSVSVLEFENKGAFFLVLTKTRNEPKRAETSQNEPKPAKTTQNFEIGEICNFLLVFVSQISCPNA